MHLIIGTDADSQANAYLQGLSRGLASCWEREGHRVTDTGSLPDASQSERVLQDPDAAVLLVSDGPVARTLARACREQGRPYTSTSIAVEGYADSTASFEAALAEIHASAERVLVPVPAACQLLAARGIRQALLINGGVDDQAYQPRVYDNLDLPRPISMLLSTGQDNDALRRFLELPLPGSKVAYVPGWTGPTEQDGVSIFSYMGAAEQASLVSAADVCVVAESGIASLVLAARSLACGVPVASLPRGLRFGAARQRGSRRRRRKPGPRSNPGTQCQPPAVPSLRQRVGLARHCAPDSRRSWQTARRDRSLSLDGAQRRLRRAALGGNGNTAADWPSGRPNTCTPIPSARSRVSRRGLAHDPLQALQVQVDTQRIGLRAQQFVKHREILRVTQDLGECR